MNLDQQCQSIRIHWGPNDPGSIEGYGKIKFYQYLTQELKLLEKFGSEYKGRNWKAVAQELKKYGFSRTQIECRYKWVNYIAPGIDHNPWSAQQLSLLFKQYETNKSQWTLIQKSMPKRTQIKIRNQFYGTIRNLLRHSIKYFKAANGRWSLISNQIKPQALQNLYDGINEFQFVGNVVKDTISRLQFKFNRVLLDTIVEENKEIFKKIVDMINTNQDFLIRRKTPKIIDQEAESKVIVSKDPKKQDQKQSTIIKIETIVKHQQVVDLDQRREEIENIHDGGEQINCNNMIPSLPPHYFHETNPFHLRPPYMPPPYYGYMNYMPPLPSPYHHYPIPPYRSYRLE